MVIHVAMHTMLLLARVEQYIPVMWMWCMMQISLQLKTALGFGSSQHSSQHLHHSIIILALPLHKYGTHIPLISVHMDLQRQVSVHQP